MMLVGQYEFPLTTYCKWYKWFEKVQPEQVYFVWYKKDYFYATNNSKVEVYTRWLFCLWETYLKL